MPIVTESKPAEPTQPTQPAKGEPVEIPVPKRGDVLGDLRKVAKPPEDQSSNSSGK